MHMLLRVVRAVTISATLALLAFACSPQPKGWVVVALQSGIFGYVPLYLNMDAIAKPIPDVIEVWTRTQIQVLNDLEVLHRPDYPSIMKDPASWHQKEIIDRIWLNCRTRTLQLQDVPGQLSMIDTVPRPIMPSSINDKIWRIVCQGEPVGDPLVSGS